MTNGKSRQTPIAVVGMSALFPGSKSEREFWDNIVCGRDLITDVPEAQWLIADYFDPDPNAPDKSYSRRGGFLPAVEFDPLEFGIPPNILPDIDTAQLLSLMVAKRALAQAAGGDLAKLDRDRVSVILGFTGAQESISPLISRLQKPVWLKALRESGIPEGEAQAICDRIAENYVPWREDSLPGLLGNVVAGRIANRLDLHGTNATIDAACASSLAAVGAAINELALGQADLVLTGGVAANSDIFVYLCFSKTPALSPTDEIRPLSDRADGLLIGQGMALFALKRLTDAERDGDRILAVIRSVGSSSDGRSKSIYAPMAEGQKRALERAYHHAGFGPETVELVEAHGTATTTGDAAEIEALTRVFVPARERARPWCAIGSVKSQIGHAMGGAGAAGLFKALMAVNERVLPPTIKVERPAAALRTEATPFYVNSVARPWIRDARHPRRAAVSSFGFGGTNYHLTVEEYRPEGGGRLALRQRVSPTELVLLGAESIPALLVQARALRDQAGATKQLSLERMARESQLHRPTAPHSRMAFVTNGVSDLAGKLSLAIARLEAGDSADFASPSGIYFSSASPEPGQTAFLFPGQGSQYVGMGADVAMAFDAARAVWDESAAVRFADRAVHELVFPHPAFDDAARRDQDAELRATEWAQPAIGLVSWSLLEVLRSVGVTPDCVAGHSFGELTALAAAGSLTSVDLMHLARRRGELMRDAAATTPGGMIAVRASTSRVEELLNSLPDDAVIANHNGPEEVVVSGSTDAIARVEAACRAAAIATIQLQVAAAFHSPLVAGAALGLRAALDATTLLAPRCDVYGNGDALPYAHAPDAIRAKLSLQLAKPVHFVAVIEAMYARGVRRFVEVGPGAVLTGLVGGILGARPHLALSCDRKGRHGLTSLQHALAHLTVSGVALDLAPLWSGLLEPEEESQAAGRTVTLTGTNFGKLYPPPGGSAALPLPNPSRAAAPLLSTESPSSSPRGGLEIIQLAQRQTAEAHALAQRAMAESHAAFLRTAEASIAAMTALLGASDSTPSRAPAPVSPSVPSVALAAGPSESIAPPANAPSPIAALPTDPRDPRELLLSIITEQTGYVTSLLGMEMELEGDLGIDSIKRVEIFAALRDRVPELPEVNPSDLAALKTLGQVVEFMRRNAPAQAVADAADAAIDPRELLLAIVAETTGYDLSMIGMEMDLEADLGLDSIRRVEIFTTMTDRFPELPAIDPNDLAALKTLGEVVELIRQRTPVAKKTSPLVANAAVERESAIAIREVIRLVPMAASVVAPSRLHAGGRIVVTEEGGGIAKALVAELARRGVVAERVDEVPADAVGVIFLGGMRPVVSIDGALAINHEALSAARRVAERFEVSPGLFVAIQDTGGDFGASGREPVRAWSGGVAALVRTARQEWRDVTSRVIDCARGDRSPEAVAHAIADELFRGDEALAVALGADGSRRVPAWSSLPATASSSTPINRESVVVASGGARGITAAALIELARAHRPRIALFGRSTLNEENDQFSGALEEPDLRRAIQEQAQKVGERLTPKEVRTRARAIAASREIRATLAALKSAGSSARYFAADVQNRESVSNALAEIRRTWGPVTALVHGAGVLADRMIAHQTDEQFAEVFATKVGGLRNLLDATADDPLTWICLFSSFAAHAGNVGQCSYAMANEVLNQVAAAEAARRGEGCLVRAIGWGPWAGGMVTPELQRHFQQLGIPLLDLTTGARAFVGESCGERSEVIVSIGGGSVRDAIAGAGIK